MNCRSLIAGESQFPRVQCYLYFLHYGIPFAHHFTNTSFDGGSFVFLSASGDIYFSNGVSQTISSEILGMAGEVVADNDLRCFPIALVA